MEKYGNCPVTAITLFSWVHETERDGKNESDTIGVTPMFTGKKGTQHSIEASFLGPILYHAVSRILHIMLHAWTAGPNINSSSFWSSHTVRWWHKGDHLHPPTSLSFFHPNSRGCSDMSRHFHHWPQSSPMHHPWTHGQGSGWIYQPESKGWRLHQVLSQVAKRVTVCLADTPKIKKDWKN